MSTFLTCQVKRTSVAAGLPNITGNIGVSDGSGSNDNVGFHPSTTQGSANGVFSIITNSTNMGYAGVGYNKRNTKYFNFNASRISSIYSNSTIVTPLSLSTLPILKY